MVKGKFTPVVEYNPHILPPRTFWKLPINLPRNQVGTFCERLNLLVSEKLGASIFFPDSENEKNTCRFEWNRRWRGDRFGLRIGLTFVVTNSALTEMEAYVTTRDLINSASGSVPQFEPALLRSINGEIDTMLRFAANEEETAPSEEWLVMFHISVPHGFGFSHSAEAANGHFKFVKTRILTKTLTRFSVLIVKCDARSAEAAKQTASADAMIALALLTLAERHKYELSTVSLPRGFNSVVRAAKPFKEQRLLPSGHYVEEIEEMDQGVIYRFEQLWTAYKALKEPYRKTFVPALLAHYAAMNSISNYATISTVGYVAALGALSLPLRNRCPGQLTCSVHGALSWKHDATSETNAIVETIITSCGIENDAQTTEIKKLVGRVYREQRSAFVHGAQLRHAEYSQGSNVPPSIPSNEGPTTELFIYQQDLASIGNLTRRTLIEWLMGKVGIPLDRDKMQINAARVVYRALVGSSVTMPPRVMVRIATKGSAIPPTSGNSEP